MPEALCLGLDLERALLAFESWEAEIHEATRWVVEAETQEDIRRRLEGFSPEELPALATLIGGSFLDPGQPTGLWMLYGNQHGSPRPIPTSQDLRLYFLTIQRHRPDLLPLAERLFAISPFADAVLSFAGDPGVPSTLSARVSALFPLRTATHERGGHWRGSGA